MTNRISAKEVGRREAKILIDIIDLMAILKVDAEDNPDSQFLHDHYMNIKKLYEHANELL